MERWEEQFAETVFRRSADTAHDLKTPLNIAVLNLELLRMRVRKLEGSGEDDEKLEVYARAIDTELRRLASIFDAFFVYSVPPRGEEVPLRLDPAEILRLEAEKHGISFRTGSGESALMHQSRIDALAKLFFVGITKLFEPTTAPRISCSKANGSMMLRVEGTSASNDHELAKVFKFYYTDPTGAPELSLAISRLIAETYGGGITAVHQDETARIELTLPVEER